MLVTLSAIKADIGGYVGHSSSHPEVMEMAKEGMDRAKKTGIIILPCPGRDRIRMNAKNRPIRLHFINQTVSPTTDSN